MSLFDKLSDLLPLKKSDSSEYYFGLNVTAESVYGCVWGIRGGKLHIVSSSKTAYESEKDLIEAANYVLDEALADFQPEPTKILFGVPDSWLADDDLKPDYLKILKQLVKELDVVPMAYVATSHALAHLLQRKTGVPVTAVLVHIANPLTVSVVKAGKVQASKELKRSSENLPKDIEKVLMSFTEVEVLPAKIIVYGEDEQVLSSSGRNRVSKYREELTSYPWMTQLPFLHLPKIEELDPQIVVEAVGFAGASEINPGVRVDREGVVETVTPDAKISKPLETTHRARGRGKTVDPELEDAGFMAGDIDEMDGMEEQMEDEAMGSGSDYAEASTDEDDVDVYGRAVPMHRGHHAPAPAHKSVLPAVPSIPIPRNIFAGLLGGNLIWLVIPVVLILLGGAFLYFQKAHVTVFVDFKTMENQATVTADPDATVVDEENKIIPGHVVTAEVSGNATGQATGKKQIGDPAKGKVIVYNATSDTLTLAKGITLANDAGQKFTLDDSVEVASKSASAADPPTKSGVVGATAAAIGPDGNIPAGQDLSVAGYSKSNVVAKVDTAFSGGVSKDVTIVSADDQSKLLAQVLSDLHQKAQQQLQSQQTDDFKVLAEALTDNVTKKSFSKNVGDQASEFTVNVTDSMKGTAYKDSDLKSIVSNLITTSDSEKFDLDLSKTETQADVSKVEKDGKLIFNAKFTAKLMPKFDMEQLKKDLRFKSVSQASDRVKQIDNVIGSTIEFTPDLPGPLKSLDRLPIMTKNITIEVTAK